MGKKHIFYAGPSLLPQEVLDSAKAALDDFAGTGVPLVCISHRTPEWGRIMEETRGLWRELLCVPDNYDIAFLPGGATMEFLFVVLNFLESKAAYLDSGHWAHKAMVEAQGFGQTVCVASSADTAYDRIPRGYTIPPDADYFHVTTGNTIYGTELLEDIQSPVPLIADMSSDILTRPVDVSRYAMIYGGAQKNAGTSGATFAIVRKGALGRVSRYLPPMLDISKHIENGSMLNTPVVFSLYVMHEMLKWCKAQGGVAEMQRRVEAKSRALYAELDSNPLFRGTAFGPDRSRVNVTFVMAPGFESLEGEFLEYAESRDIVGIKGHRVVGGFRASLYNACTQEDVDALVRCMRDFAKMKIDQ